MLSLLHQVLLAVTLGLCVFVLVPRMFGGAGGRSERGGPDPGRLSAHQQGKVNFGSGRQHLVHREGKTYENIQQMRNAVEQNIKERSKGHGKGLTFTLMPLYAIGVGVFAAYKFLKIKSKEESSSRMEKNEEDKKAKETENQLLELEQRLAQTETMLNSLLSQLDPLSNWLPGGKGQENDAPSAQTLKPEKKCQKPFPGCSLNPEGVNVQWAGQGSPLREPITQTCK
ncbi:coiled-coil domain-containing protein 107-like isoform X2 [Rhinatrema bivittatum]|uniref:coiled-coil domain-containing protein 107-like isoform X2 n=1 Tax=Rhinatrema bivittatum TaxID=194408 RepID=UPI0011270BDB|nr:coiled-coil domain-containing protein 107-like isoform X2 [Rhinatrema bivittatum]